MLFLQDHQFSALPVYLKFQRMPLSPSGILVRLLLPLIVGLQKSSVNLFLRLQPGFHRFLVILIGSQVKPFSLKTDIDPVASVLQLEYSPETAGVVSAVLPVFQDFHTGAVDPVELVDDLLLILPLEAATALVISPHKAVLRHLNLLSAVTDTPPVDGALPVSSVRRFQSLQPPESPPGQIHTSPAASLTSAIGDSPTL